MNENNVSGPFFISLGTPEKLQKFLKLNPTVPRNMIFVEDFQTMEIYNQLGFDQFGLGTDDLSNLGRVQIPILESIGQYWNYVSSIPSIGPFAKDNRNKYGIPEAGLKLGGTFVIRGSDIIYEWRDKLPGDLPNPKDVLSTIQQKQRQERD